MEYFVFVEGNIRNPALPVMPRQYQKPQALPLMPRQYQNFQYCLGNIRNARYYR